MTFLVKLGKAQPPKIVENSKIDRIKIVEAAVNKTYNGRAIFEN
jgi:hypothetical protein